MQISRPGELVAALAPANALYQAAAAQESHQLVHVGMAQPFVLGDLGRRYRCLRLPGDLEQAPKPVFFLRCEPHLRPRSRPPGP